jgi:crossover junction endodeoxyribonuclease RuvC
MIIIGIDPGTANTGFGVIRVADDIIGRKFDYGLELIDYGNIVTPKEKLMPDRLLQIHLELTTILEKYKPDLMAMEMLFFGANTKTAITVGQARGVVLLSAARYQIQVTDYTGLQVKLMVAGSGKADKDQVHQAVRKWLGENGKKRRKLEVHKKGEHLDDATDAVAIAICHVLKLAAA